MRRKLWGNLGLLVEQFMLIPALFIGDFNCTRQQSERILCKPRFKESRYFNAWVNRINLSEIPSTNGSMTWVGANGKRSTLDRAIGNMDWTSLGSWQTRLLPRKSSDHRGLLVEVKESIWGPKLFKFFNVWLKNKSWRDCINPLLQKESKEPGVDIQQIFRKIKSITKVWKEEEGDMYSRIQNLEELLASKEDQGGHLEEIQGLSLELEDLKKPYVRSYKLTI